MKNITTLHDIESIQREFLLIREVAPVLGADPQSIRCQAQSDPTKLGFPVVVIKSRVKIPKRPFIQFMTELQKGDLLDVN